MRLLLHVFISASDQMIRNIRTRKNFLHKTHRDQHIFVTNEHTQYFLFFLERRGGGKGSVVKMFCCTSSRSSLHSSESYFYDVSNTCRMRMSSL